MNVEEIKSEIRKLSRADKIEIYRWIDEEAAADLLSRIGLYRSREIRQEIEKACKKAPRISPFVPDLHNGTELRKQDNPVVRSRFNRPQDR